MLVNRQIAIGVLHGHYVPAFVGPVRKNDITVSDGPDGRPLVDRDIYTEMAHACIEAPREKAVGWWQCG